MWSTTVRVPDNLILRAHEIARERYGVDRFIGDETT